MKEGKEPEYLEKTPDDELQKMTQSKARKSKPQPRLEPALWHWWQARKADVLTITPRVAPKQPSVRVLRLSLSFDGLVHTVPCCATYCPGHAEVSGNERADRLTSTADITSGLQLGRAALLRGLRNLLNTDRPQHHSICHLKERRVEKGSGRHSTLQGRERSMFNQTNIGAVSRATLGRLLRDGAEHVWAFSSATMPS